MSYKSWTLSWRFFELKFSGSFYFHSYDEIFADVCFTHTDPYFIRFQSLSLSLYHSPTRGRPPLKHRTHAHKTSMFQCTRFYWKFEGSHHILYSSVLHFRSSCSWKLLIFFPPATLRVSDTSCSLSAHWVTSWDNPVFKLAALVPDFSICSPEIETTSEVEIILSSPSGCSCGFLVGFSSC